MALDALAVAYEHGPFDLDGFLADLVEHRFVLANPRTGRIEVFDEMGETASVMREDLGEILRKTGELALVMWLGDYEAVDVMFFRMGESIRYVLTFQALQPDQRQCLALAVFHRFQRMVVQGKALGFALDPRSNAYRVDFDGVFLGDDSVTEGFPDVLGIPLARVDRVALSDDDDVMTADFDGFRIYQRGNAVVRVL
jgi:hypothetical protein